MQRTFRQGYIWKEASPPTWATLGFEATSMRGSNLWITPCHIQSTGKSWQQLCMWGTLCHEFANHVISPLRRRRRKKEYKPVVKMEVASAEAVLAETRKLLPVIRTCFEIADWRKGLLTRSAFLRHRNVLSLWRGLFVWNNSHCHFTLDFSYLMRFIGLLFPTYYNIIQKYVRAYRKFSDIILL